MLVLGIESSCDETGVALYSSTGGLVAHALHSQVATHRQFGGVVPELASRDHVKHIVTLVDAALKEAALKKTDITAVAYTAGPGLMGALLVGASFAKSFAFALGIPSFAVHHLEAHILAAQLDAPSLQFPFTALLVSGGHTQLIEAHGLGNYTLLGETLDDAVGEAFDKTAKLMGFEYPGGPTLAALADEAAMLSDLPEIAAFPRPMLDRPGFDLSFSGLKTHTMLAWKKSKQTDVDKRCIAKAFQDAVVETLCVKTMRALASSQSKCLVVAGGVGANRALREALTTRVQADGGAVYFPRLEYCTDNGAMVAYAGYLHLMQGARDASHAIEVHARLPLQNQEAI
ncbi:MAG: tRNA (adenosine(37)-N6)-threonylcarbamoyltransferase complex transferase subunit TsaD [Gammaproteobacteria bacterium]|nr:tRNA (adenosine(37)-N6)-threonylcarbamoyltransferase complex transferase subunit TsaD [Gammaproteobacteria bacterium]MCH9716071.1 tRNA (adenosine(37)-N6)-threonylcarbamoyltransferase complex transferase subunit TsaD [Gammaproteobacteria bacterium]MCH9763412.1 tRNA (adenosine(37)-N6)-threonylcarbamoyltransferase complex transferase subunit TsaD [Gammaproteobacteria bacterium]